MFSSIRSRLWLTYALIIGVVLTILGLALGVYLIRNPLAVRSTLQRLNILSNIVVLRSSDLENLNPPRLQLAVERADAVLDVRIVVLDSDGKTIADSRQSEGPRIPIILWSGIPQGTSQDSWFRDERGQLWLYHIRPIQNNMALVLTAPRPRFQILGILRDEFLRPFEQAGLAALFLALILSFGIARWVASPLQRMAQEARAISSGEYHSIPLEGPAEVKQLAQSFNEMGAQVKLSQQSQRDFVANISHELKTPLTSIRGFAQAILDGTADDPEELHRAAEVIHVEAERMSRLVADLLDLARLDSGTVDFHRDPIDLLELLEKLVDKFIPMAQEQQTGIKLEAEPMPVLHGDSDWLSQVFINLIDNGLKFSASGGEVVIRAFQRNNRACIRVEDSGPGIPQEDLKRIFERFYQVDKSRSRAKDRGVGLGLAIAREIVQAHHGEINAYSNPGDGCVFEVDLPLG